MKREKQRWNELIDKTNLEEESRDQLSENSLKWSPRSKKR